MVSSRASTVRVVVVDDHDAFRAGLRRLLARLDWVEVVHDAADAETGIQSALAHRPDVVLMDLHMPGMRGVEAVGRLADVLPTLPVVVLTVSGAEADVREALLAGAAGYVLKGASASELGLALRAVHGGDRYLSPRVAGRLLEDWREAQRRGAEGASAQLSDRELEVLKLVAAGAENTEVAARLCISPHTVKRHVAAILSKLGAENRTQAAVQAVRQDLI